MSTTLHLNSTPGQYPDSYYHATATGERRRGRLTTNTSADVCIIGGGFTGLSSALHLAQLGIEAIVLDAHRVGWGASGRNGGQASSGQRLDQDALESLVGVPVAKEAWRIGVNAPRLVRSLIQEHSIDAQWQTGIVGVNHKQRFDAQTEAYVKKLQDDYDYHQIEWLSTEDRLKHIKARGYFGGYRDTNSGHLHPLNYAFGLASAAGRLGVRIYEQTEVEDVRDGSICTITTNSGHKIKASKVLYACNGYLGFLREAVGRRLMPINNFMVATQPLAAELSAELLPSDAAVYDSRFVVNYFRLSRDNRLLFGGGETYGYRFPDNIAEFVRRPLLTIFPELRDVKIEYAWGGTLGITMTRLPDFQKLTSNVYSMSGYSGAGVSMATMAGKIFADMIHGDDRDFEIMAQLPTPDFPASRLPFSRYLRAPMLAMAMKFYAIRDQW